jgi:hypothetical protein
MTQRPSPPENGGTDADPKDEPSEGGMKRFEALTKGLLGVSREDLKKEEAKEKRAKAKPPKAEA